MYKLLKITFCTHKCATPRRLTVIFTYILGTFIKSTLFFIKSQGIFHSFPRIIDCYNINRGAGIGKSGKPPGLRFLFSMKATKIDKLFTFTT